MGLGAAVLGAAGLGAVGSLGGAFLQSGAATTAAGEQAQSAQNALALQQSMWGTAKNALSPYATAGQKVLPSLQSLITPGPNQTKTLEQLPGFQFQSQWGNLAATNQLAAEGLGGSAGPVGTALSNYNQGLASTYWMNDVNALQQYANMGMGAGSALAGNATNAGNAMAQTQMAQGSAEAAGTLGSANALSTGLGSLGSSAGNALLLSSILGGAGGGSGLYGALGSGVSAIQNSYAL